MTEPLRPTSTGGETRVPIRTASATDAGAPRSPARPLFVGRAAEVARLESMLADAEQGIPQVAMIEGPPGIGKTRLAEEVAERAAGRGGHAAIGGCWQDGEAPPLWPWRAILRELEAPAALLEGRADAPRDRFGRFEAVLEHLRSVSRHRASPLVVVVDDAHRSDLQSLLLVRFLARSRSLRMLILLTRRRGQSPPGDAGALLSELERDVVVVPLEGLSEEAVEAFLDAAGAPRPERELVKAVAAVTQGNPLHLRNVAVLSELKAGVKGGLERTIGDLLLRLDAADRRCIALSALVGMQLSAGTGSLEVSVLEVARIAGSSPAEAAESLARAVQAGLAQELPGGRFAFVHDLVREVAMAALPLPERLEAHARAARELGGHEQAHVARRAHHALKAASRSREDAEAALTVACAAARALRRDDGFEPAAELLGCALDIHASAGLAGPVAALAVERAECVLACGRLGEARPLFQHAARLAESEGDVRSLALAALGLGGVWVSEHRLVEDAQRVRALQQRALEALPANEEVLRARLRFRLAVEEAYRAGQVAPVGPAVEAVRRTGDAHALAEALSLAHHAVMTPQHARTRQPIAAGVVAAAALAGDSLLGLVGLCWQTVDLFLLGEPSATESLDVLRRRADTLRCRGLMFIVGAIDVMLAVRAGDFEGAERIAEETHALGREAGDADALSYHGAHLLAIRYYQGREHELHQLVATIAASPTLIQERERTFGAASALFALRAGRPQAARALLERLHREGLDSIPPSSSWLTTLMTVVELAASLQDGRVAQAAYNALLPHADLPLMASMAIVCFGSVHRCLGVAAQACGKLELAIEHFAAGLAANERLGHRPAALQCQAELALARLQRSASGRDPRGRALLQQAMAEASALGMSARVERWRQAAGGAALTAGSTGPAALMTMVQGGKCRIVLHGSVATVADRVGTRYLARLLASPDHGIRALALVADNVPEPKGQNADPVLDGKAMRALRERLRELQESAEPSPAEREELSALRRELARATGLGGRIRSFADAPERARTSVRKAVKRAIEEIAAANPTIGRHLARRIETGTVCRYRVEGIGEDE
jgi:tetratricopeptide (TPR) repeat protein